MNSWEYDHRKHLKKSSIGHGIFAQTVGNTESFLLIQEEILEGDIPDKFFLKEPKYQLHVYSEVPCLSR